MNSVWPKAVALTLFLVTIGALFFVMFPTAGKARANLRVLLVASQSGSAVPGARFNQVGRRIVPSAIALLKDPEVRVAANQLLIRCATALGKAAPLASAMDAPAASGDLEARSAQRSTDWAAWYHDNKGALDRDDFICFPALPTTPAAPSIAGSASAP